MVEICNPNITNSSEYYYEVGNRYAITNAGASNRSYSALSGVVTGDVRIKQRVVKAESYYTEVMNINDRYWKNWYADYGRIMIKSDVKVSRVKTNLAYSDPFTYMSNGLSSFTALNFTVLPLEMSSIQRITLTSKIQDEGTIMISVGETQTAAIYLGETQVFDNSGASFISKSSGVIGNVNILKGSFGTMHPESVSKYEGQVFFFDSNKGKVIRYDSNGLFPISDIKMSKYFRKVGSDILASRQDGAKYANANPLIPLRINTITDPYTNEFLIHTPRMDANVQNELLEDMVTGSTSYSFTITSPPLSCDFAAVAYLGSTAAGAQCSFSGVAY